MNNLITQLINSIHQRVFGAPISNEMVIFLKRLGLLSLSGFVYGIIILAINLFGARSLGPEAFGHYQLGLTLLNLFIIPLSIGGSIAIIKLVSGAENKGSAISSTLILLILNTTIVGLIAIFLSRYAGFIHIPKEIWVISVTVAVFSVLYSAAKNYYQSLGRFSNYAVVEVIVALTAVTFFIFSLRNGLTSTKLLAVLAIGYSTGFTLIFLNLFPKLQKPQVIYFSNYLKYGISAMVIAISSFIYGNIDRFFLNSFHGPEAVGITSAYFLSGTLIFGPVIQVFGTVFFPTIVGYSSPETSRSVREKLNRLFLTGLVVLLPVIILVSSAFFIFLGGEYKLNLALVLIFSLSIFLSLFSTIEQLFLTSFAKARGLQDSTINAVWAAITAVVLGYFLIKGFGIIGAAISNLAAQTVVLFLARKKSQALLVAEPAG